MTDFKLLEKLCTVEGISGDEGSVREIIINEIKPFADEIKTDNLGNIIVFKKRQKPSKGKTYAFGSYGRSGLYGNRYYF